MAPGSPSPTPGGGRYKRPAPTAAPTGAAGGHGGGAPTGPKKGPGWVRNNPKKSAVIGLAVALPVAAAIGKVMDWTKHDASDDIDIRPSGNTAPHNPSSTEGHYADLPSGTRFTIEVDAHGDAYVSDNSQLKVMEYDDSSNSVRVGIKVGAVVVPINQVFHRGPNIKD
ncbi:hypothetical protein KBD59_05355 [Candidatus Gracilibacteria bacterium]|nr:hypothetical protein [Candidatus Gracilibacteria bacterium]